MLIVVREVFVREREVDDRFMSEDISLIAQNHVMAPPFLSVHIKFQLSYIQLLPGGVSGQFISSLQNLDFSP